MKSLLAIFRWLGPLFGGFMFALGLAVSGMTEPAKIIGFLDIFGQWDPTLIFVLLGAVGINMIAYRFSRSRSKPLFDVEFHIPTRRDIDAKLVVGSVIFGVGWGIGGLCPGPGLAALVTLKAPALIFMGSMLSGAYVTKVFLAKKEMAVAPTDKQKPMKAALTWK